uniref:Uncharacterized protein n=1 Tax=Tanacetum cinerariifolium TaxID=118510 RepID=A0A699R7B0_TANCI|nr:hypothetical protein [Tanacetum cinerariifolium]
MPPGSPSHQPPPPPPPAGPSGTSGAPRASGSQVIPPPPPPPTSTNQDSPSTGLAAPSFAKTVATTEHQSCKGRRPALSISKMKAAYYPNTRLEQMVPGQFLIEEECKYDIAAMYGISHWWFQRQ